MHVRVLRRPKRPEENERLDGRLRSDSVLHLKAVDIAVRTEARFNQCKGASTLDRIALFKVSEPLEFLRSSSRMP